MLCSWTVWDMFIWACCLPRSPHMLCMLEFVSNCFSSLNELIFIHLWHLHFIFWESGPWCVHCQQGGEISPTLVKGEIPWTKGEWVQGESCIILGGAPPQGESCIVRWAIMQGEFGVLACTFGQLCRAFASFWRSWPFASSMAVLSLASFLRGHALLIGCVEQFPLS